MERLPGSHHLVVTTAKGVYIWTNHGVSEIFSSNSGGIIAAKKPFDSSNKLAVADSHGVILHDPSQGMQGSFRLKGVEVSTHSLGQVLGTDTNIALGRAKSKFGFCSTIKTQKPSSLP